jgi:hypothetical protein
MLKIKNKAKILISKKNLLNKIYHKCKEMYSLIIKIQNKNKKYKYKNSNKRIKIKFNKKTKNYKNNKLMDKDNNIK